MEQVVLDWVKNTCDNKKVFPIPKNGLIIALKAGLNIVDSPEKADIIFDDVCDSGRTIKPYLESGKQLVVLYVKKHTPYKAQLTYFEEKEDWVVFPWEKENEVEDNIVRILEHLGEDPTREGLLETPKRVVKSYKELYSGYDKKVEDVLTVFEDDGYDGMVLLKDIEFYSTCEHHMLPFFGKAHVAYIPNGKVVGISKLARIVEIYARRLQNQERLTKQVADAIQEYLDPKGVAVVMEAQHFCMRARGIQKQNSAMKTAELTGNFKSQPETRAEFYTLLEA